MPSEHSYVKRTHELLKKRIKAEDLDLGVWKVHDNITSGPADARYEGNRATIWCEYKYIKSIPKRPLTFIKPKLGALQRDWLKASARRNRGNPYHKVWVVIGSPEGGLVLPDYMQNEWENGVPVHYFREYMIGYSALVDRIVRNTCGSTSTESSNDSSGQTDLV